MRIQQIGNLPSNYLFYHVSGVSKLKIDILGRLVKGHVVGVRRFDDGTYFVCTSMKHMVCGVR